MFAADNHFKLFVNGTNVGGGDDWQHPKSIDIAQALRPGANVIAVRGENDPDSGSINAAAVIGKIRIEQEGDGIQEIVTDAKWESAEAVDASAWKPVTGRWKPGHRTWGDIQDGSGIRAGEPVDVLSEKFQPSRETHHRPRADRRGLEILAVDQRQDGGPRRRPETRPKPAGHVFRCRGSRSLFGEGDNQIAALAWYFGKDGFSHKSSGKPGFLFEMDADGCKVLSDSSWKTVRHPSFGEASNSPNFRLAESSVRFDARLDMPEWTASGFDDSAWKAPMEFGVPPVAPWNRLWERAIPQWKDFGLKDYENAAKLPKQGGGDAISAELPYNAQVTPWLKVSAPAGRLIKIGTDNANNDILAEYITREGEQEFETPAG